MIPYGKQTIDEEDIKSVLDVLKDEFLTTGPKIAEFEQKVCDFVECKYAVAVSSGTAALHLACLASGLKKDEELITTPITFAASANCALYCNAKPVFVDINEQGLIDENKIERKITNKTRIIIPVHYTGLSCDLEKIKKITDKYNLVLIEDACHALGAKYKDSKIGDCKYSDMTIFSFHPVKHITTGEGGMITTNSKEIYERLKSLRNHGIINNSEKFINKNPEPGHYEMQFLGYNYKITDFQCALGISQLNKINEFINKRRKIAEKYDKAFENNKDIEIIKENQNQFNPYPLYVIKLKDKETRSKLFNYLKENNIFCQVHYIPVYLHPYYHKLGYQKGICPNAEEFYKRIISLPIYPKLSEAEQDYIIEKINNFFQENEKQILFRKAGGEDCLDLFKWRNDKITRQNSFNTELISFETHKQWFENCLKDPSRDLFILLDNNKKIGTIRFDYKEDKNCAEINITIAPESRNKGYSSKAIRTLSLYYLDDYNLNYIFAEIKPQNTISMKSFIKAGYNFYKEFPDKIEYRFEKKNQLSL